MRRGGSPSPRGGGGTYDVSPFSLAAAHRVSGFHSIAPREKSPGKHPATLGVTASQLTVTGRRE